MATTPVLSSDVVEDSGCFEEKPWELRRECTVPKVKEEAEKVLDVFLKRSLSMNDASPRRKYMIKVRKEVGRGKTISKYSDIAEETDLTNIGRSSFRKAVEHSVIDNIEDDVDDDEDSEPKSSSAPGSLHYRVQLKPTEETLRKLDQLQAKLENQSPGTPSRKKKHSFSSFAKSIQNFLKSPTKSKKLGDFKEADKKEKEKEHKKLGIRASFRKKFAKKEKRKASKEREGGSQDSILTPSSAASDAITPSSLSSNDILESDSATSKKTKKYKKHRGYDDAMTPDSAAVTPDAYPNGGIGQIYTSAADQDVMVRRSEEHENVHLVSRDGRYTYRCQVYRSQTDNKRESKESEKMKDYPEEFPLIYNGGSDDTDGPGASRLSDFDQVRPRVRGPARPTSLNLPSSAVIVPDRLARPATAVGLNGITEALEMELDRDLRIRHDSAGDLPSDVVTDGGNEDLSSEEEYKPFKDRSEKEKEKLYEKIAARLSAIGDRVAVDHSLAAEFDDGLGAVGGESDAEKKRIEIEQPDGNFEKEEEPLNFTENDARMLGLRLRDHGDRRSSSEVFSIPLNVLMSVVRNTAYDSFKDVAQTVIGQDTSWKELALVLRLTRDAIKIAGYTPGVVRKIKDNTLRFIGDRFAEWISSQGGWSSCIGEIISESESEVD